MPDRARRRGAAHLPLYLRACLLQEVVDSVADPIEAGTAPGQANRVGTEKQAVHRRALDRYRVLHSRLARYVRA